MADYTNFTFDTDSDGIALVTWDMPGRSMNVIDQPVMEEFATIIDRVAEDDAVKGAVLASGKKAFGAGADPHHAASDDGRLRGQEGLRPARPPRRRRSTRPTG